MCGHMIICQIFLWPYLACAYYMLSTSLGKYLIVTIWSLQQWHIVYLDQFGIIFHLFWRNHWWITRNHLHLEKIKKIPDMVWFLKHVTYFIISNNSANGKRSHICYFNGWNVSRANDVIVIQTSITFWTGNLAVANMDWIWMKRAFNLHSSVVSAWYYMVFISGLIFLG